MQLSKELSGTLHFDTLMRTIYSTDASIYKQLPLAVAYPKSKADLKTLVSLGFLDKIQVNKKKQNFIKSREFDKVLKKYNL